MTPPLQTLLDVVGIEPDEVLSVLRRPLDGRISGGRARADDLLSRPLPEDSDIWVGVNPLSLPPLSDGPRGGEADVLRIPALAVDIDVRGPTKPDGGMPDEESALAVVQDAAVALGTLPAAVVHSGHGLQAFWAVEVMDSIDVQSMRVRAARFQVMMHRLAVLRGGQIDRLRDIARVWRVPGSVNLKDPRDPRRVTADYPGGHPLPGERIDEVLDAYAVPMPQDDVPGDPVDMDDLPWAEGTCGYVRMMVAGWARDTPPARHPWLVSQSIRIEAARRNGCLDADGYIEARGALSRRFTALVGGDPHRRSEPANARFWALDAVSCKTSEQVADELGKHTHDDLGDEDFWERRPLFQWCREAGDARYMSPNLLLGHMLAHVCALVGPNVVLPGIIGSEASLNIAVGAVTPSGGGKTAVAGIVAEANVKVKTAGMGTTEGFSDQYGAVIDGVMQWTHHSVLFTCDEIETTLGTAGRQGNTMLSTFRSAISGAGIYISYRSRPVALPAKEYTAAMVLAGQAMKFGPLLTQAEIDGGTPQRLVWFDAGGRELPKPRGRAGAAVPPIPWDVPVDVRADYGKKRIAMDFPESIWIEVQQAWIDAQSGVVGSLASHRMLTRLKVAALLALAEGRFTVADRDWEDSDAIMARSDATLRTVMEAHRNAVIAEHRARGVADAIREGAKARAEVERAAKVLGRHVHRHEADCGRRCGKDALGRDRKLLPEALVAAVEAGWIVESQVPSGSPNGEPRRLLVPGPKVPL